jgi:hypothetical protein
LPYETHGYWAASGYCWGQGYSTSVMESYAGL